ncbi:oxidoreductase [Armillaria luteobubalina]|uniref:Ceramide very long chain fatty acid hydroxylase n=1 Tax=Armillaria luteobubalina TaxID=153913 RepID=A0AA39QB82_9AGAR|nr:oxidoreductase [Armillaria luteobubalina]
MSKRIRIYSPGDLKEHVGASSCWVSYQEKVYDITGFLADHPGGEDILLRYAGQPIEDVMSDKNEHQHSEAAYDMLEEFLIGRVGNEENTCSQDWVVDEDFHPEDTDLRADFAKNAFLDLSKPLLPQVWYANFSKNFYLQQIHQPRHLSYSARLFGPAYLEVFTKCVWYAVPLVWIPIATYLALRSIVQFSMPIPSVFVNPILPVELLSEVPIASYTKFAICFIIGNIIWTILEYGMHRFLFHLDENLPDKGVFLTLHFLLHGVHHYLPMDRMRLVMPPILFTALQFPFTQLAYKLFPTPVANGIIAGAFAFYVIYDTMHYALHHTNLPAYLKEQKRYHLAHHYKNYELAFGVTSKFWDHIFGTVLPL